MTTLTASSNTTFRLDKRLIIDLQLMVVTGKRKILRLG